MHTNVYNMRFDQTYTLGSKNKVDKQTTIFNLMVKEVNSIVNSIFRHQMI